MTHSSLTENEAEEDVARDPGGGDGDLGHSLHPVVDVFDLLELLTRDVGAGGFGVKGRLVEGEHLQDGLHHRRPGQEAFFPAYN